MSAGITEICCTGIKTQNIIYPTDGSDLSEICQTLFRAHYADLVPPLKKKNLNSHIMKNVYSLLSLFKTRVRVSECTQSFKVHTLMNI